jgi:hypothetical protein
VLDEGSLLQFVAVGVAWLGVYGALVWRFAMQEPERRTMGDAFGRSSASAVAADEPLP